MVVLEGISNHDNVGGVFRNATALGASCVLLDETCADPLYRKSIRVSMGASLQVPFVHVDSTADAIAPLRTDGVTVLALTPLFTMMTMWVIERAAPGLVKPENLNALSITGAGVVVAGSMLVALSPAASRSRTRSSAQPAKVAPFDGGNAA